MKITISGGVFVGTSTITKEQYETLRKNKPEALKITDNEGNDVFNIAYPGKAAITKFGVTFDGVTRDEKQFLTFTILFPKDTENVKEYIADEVGGVLAHIDAIEKKVASTYTKVVEARKKLIEEIDGE